jgi:hypothetical protein
MEKIFSDEEAFDQIKDKSRKAWHDFKAFTPQTISMRATLVKKPSSPSSKILGRRRKLQHLHCGLLYPEAEVWLEAAVSTQGHHVYQEL